MQFSPVWFDGSKVIPSKFDKRIDMVLRQRDRWGVCGLGAQAENKRGYDLGFWFCLVGKVLESNF